MSIAAFPARLNKLLVSKLTMASSSAELAVATIKAEGCGPTANCAFEVTHNLDLTVSFKADNGKYLERDVFQDTIKATDSSIGASSKFTMEHPGNGKVTLKADNGDYWGRVYMGGMHVIRAVKTSSADVYAQFDRVNAA